MINLARSVISWYSASLKARPMTTKVLTSVVTFGSADLMSQFGVERKTLHQYDPYRTLKTIGIGSMYMVPWLHLWHSRVGPRIVSMYPKQPFKRTALCIVADQSAISPFLLCSNLFLIEAFKNIDLKAGFLAV
jgi:hypothetical protein